VVPAFPWLSSVSPFSGFPPYRPAEVLYFFLTNFYNFHPFWILRISKLSSQETRCSILHVGRANYTHQHRLGAELLERSPVEKELGVLVDQHLLTTGWPWASIVPWCPRWLMGFWGALHRAWPGGWRRFSPLLCPGEGTSGALCQVLVFPVPGRLGTAGRAQWRTAELVRSHLLRRKGLTYAYKWWRWSG